MLRYYIGQFTIYKYPPYPLNTEGFQVTLNENSAF